MPHWKFVYEKDYTELYNEINWELSPDLRVAKFYRSELFTKIALACCLLLCLKYIFGVVF